MWRLCCIINRKESKIVESKRHSKVSVNLLPAVSTEPAASLANLYCEDYRRPSWKKFNGYNSDSQSRRHSIPYFELDLETGRRPTLVVETTARLAVAESIDLENSRRGSSTSAQGVYKPLGGMSSKRKLTPGHLNESSTIDTSSSLPLPYPPPTIVPVINNDDPTVSPSPGKAKKSGGFIKFRSPGSSFRKRMLQRKGGGSSSGGRGFSRLNFMSRRRPLKDLGGAGGGGGVGGGTFSKMEESGPLSTSGSRRDSLYIFSHTDEPIVTPFAQILASLRKVRSNFICLTNVHSSRDSRFGTSHTEDSRRIACLEEDPPNSLAVETLEELEWCLERLESIQTHRSVSDMASSKDPVNTAEEKEAELRKELKTHHVKFKKMLNKELSQVYDGDKIDAQISEYIWSTFLDQEEQPTDSQIAGPSGAGADEASSVAKTTSGTEVTSPSSGAAVSGDQRTITTASGGELRKLQTGGGSIIMRMNKETAKKLASAAENRHQAESGSSQSAKLVTSIVGNQRTVLSLGVDTKKLVLFEDKAEPPPTYGIISEHPEEMAELLETSLDKWGMDIFKLAECTTNPLTCVTYTILKRRGLMNKFKIPHWNLLRFLQSVEAHYNDYTPYHNKIHAADVVQSVHVLLQAPALDSVFTDLELAAVIIACAVHDVNHPGVTNQYLVNSGDALALLYNDASVLENYHLAVAFNLLTHSGCDILVNFSKKQRTAFRRMVIDMVLSTDMSKHMSLLAELKTMVETKKVSGSAFLSLDSYTDRMQILQNMVHCADLSNTAKPLDLYTKWMNRLMEEFFIQGDRERSLGLDISPMCDRETATVEKSQVSFIDFISHPLWETWSDLVHPAAQDILELLESNRNWYFNLIHADDHQHQSNITTDTISEDAAATTEKASSPR